MIFKALLVFVPVSLGLAYIVRAAPLWVFLTSAMAIVPLAEWIRRATEQIGKRAGSAIGGLLNVAFGNVTELLLALFVVAAGKPLVAKAQITGSIMGNGLLGLGLAIAVGSWGRERQTLIHERAGNLDERLSVAVSVVLIVVYVANLLYTLATHRDVFGLEDQTADTAWPLWHRWR